MKLKFNGILTLLLALTVQFVFAQKSVSGTVSDENGPLPGVSVIIKGTKTGTETDFDGKYSLQAKQGDELQFSYVGMVTQVIKVGSSNVYNVSLVADANVLDEVVITTALGQKKVKDAVTSTTTILDASQIKSASNPDAVRSLAGKVSGVTVNAVNSGVAGESSIQIRSMLSISGANNALVVIDGLISNATVLASLSPDAIDNISVLKGAQGAALYGSQGKNGAVIVTTKKGKKGERFSFNVNSATDFENISFVPERQNKYGQGWFGAWDQYENGGWGELFSGEMLPVGIADENGNYVMSPYSSKGSDVIKEFYNQGYIFQNGFSMSAANDKSYISLNYANTRRNFIVEGDQLSKNNILLNAGTSLGKLKLGGSVNYTNNNINQANVTASTSRSDYTLLTNLMQAASNIPIGEFKDRGLYGWNIYYQNPFWAKDNNRLDDNQNALSLGLNTDYKINDHFSLSQNGGLYMQSNGQKSYGNEAVDPQEVFDLGSSFASPSYYYQSQFRRLNLYTDLLLHFDYEFNENVGLKSFIGQNFQYFSQSRMSQGGVKLDIPGFYHINNVTSPANPTSLLNTTYNQKITATYANADINYSDYLFLNLTARYEGNSVAPKGKQFYFYPSAGLSFVPTKAFDGMKDSNVLSKLKVYANYSKIGSLDPISPYEILSLGGYPSGFPYGDLSSYSNLTSVVDANIKPEMYTTLEAGANFGFFKNQAITLDVAVYKSTTDDLITNISLPTSSGYYYKKTNRGTLEAKGLELDFGYNLFQEKAFNWKGNISYSHGETIAVDTGESDKISLYDGDDINADISAVKGKPFPYITGTDWTRDENGNVIIGTDGMPVPTSAYVNLGRTTPKYIIGWSNSFSFKGFTLGFTADYRTGHYFVSQTKYNLTWNGHLYESGLVDRQNGWLFPSSVIDDPATTAVDYIPNTTVLTGGGYDTQTNNKTITYYGKAAHLGSHNVVDATALKVREISLSYNLNEEFVNRLHLSSLKLSLTARNPFILLADDNRGYADPEGSNQRSYTNTTAAKGATGTFANTSVNGIGFIGDGAYPATRTYGFTVNIGF